MLYFRDERTHPIDRFFDLSLIGMLLSGFLALAASGSLDPVTFTLTSWAFALRLALVVMQKRLEPPAVFVNMAVIAYAGFYPLDYYWISEDFLAATVRLVCFLTIAKGLTVLTHRDALYAVLIAFGELLAAALLSNSPLFFFFLSLFLFAGVTTFASWQVRLGAHYAGQALQAAVPRFSSRLLAISGATTLSIVLFTVGMFFVLPRTARAALQNFVSGRYHLPGFSGQVRLGDIGDIQASERTMMHIRLDTPGPETLPYKWRGSALSEFDGRRWTQRGVPYETLRFQHGALRLPTRDHLARRGTRIRYQVQLSEPGLQTVFVAGVPEFLEANLTSVVRQPAGTLRTGADAPDLLRYIGSSFLDESAGDGAPAPTAEERRETLSMPVLDPRVAALARAITVNDHDDWRRARRIESWLQTNLAYTLEQPSTPPADPLANFLFDRKRGHCEYFASAMAVMLRTLGIPSRVITGFQGGTRNPMSGWYVLRAADAHSWVEAWIPNNGWTIFDPTPIGGRPVSAPFFRKLANLLDAGDLFWQEWVMQYDLERQFKLAMRLETARSTGSGRPSLSSRLQDARDGAEAWLRQYGLWALGLFLFCAAVWLVTPYARTQMQERRRRARLLSGAATQSDATLLYRRLLALLEQRGTRKPAWYTPLEFAHVLPPSETTKLIANFTHAYNRFRFGQDPAAAQQMLDLYDQVERSFAQATAESELVKQ